MILVAIRACYPVHDFQFDVSDAFQSTRTDDPLEMPKPVSTTSRREVLR
jgi:hypothetical protein